MNVRLQLTSVVFFGSLQSKIFRGFLLFVILCNCLIVSLETTDLGNRIPQFFKVMDDIFLAVFVMEFGVKVYTQPVQYWKSYFNMLDFAVLVTFVSQIVLGLVYHQHQGILIVNVMKGIHSNVTVVL